MNGHDRVRWLAATVAIVLAAATTASSRADDEGAAEKDRPAYKQLPKAERPTWRVEWANDATFDSDNVFTNGFSVQKFSTRSDSLDDVRGAPAWGKESNGC